MKKHRDMKKAILDYKDLLRRKDTIHSNFGAFYLDDIDQIWRLCEETDPHRREFDMIGNALDAGFMIGYRTAKREAARKAHSKKEVLG